MKFEGIYTPAITPLTAEGAIDSAAFAEVLEYLIESKVHGIIIGGSTGEYYAHTAQERFDLAAQAKDVINGRLPLIVAHSGTFRVLCEWLDIPQQAAPVANSQPLRLRRDSALDRWISEAL